MIAINREKTKQINMVLQQIEQCECEDCQRFYKYIEQSAPAKLHAFFDNIGIDLQKYQDLEPFNSHGSGNHYTGFFQISVNDAPNSSDFQISEEWENYQFDHLCLRLRAERTLDGGYILAFEVDLPAKV